MAGDRDLVHVDATPDHPLERVVGQHALPPPPSDRAAAPGSAVIVRNAATVAARSPGRTRNPFSPLRFTTSAIWAMSDAITGTPVAIASTSTIGAPSFSSVKRTNASDTARYRATTSVGRLPANVTLSATPQRVGERFETATVGPVTDDDEPGGRIELCKRRDRSVVSFLPVETPEREHDRLRSETELGPRLIAVARMEDRGVDAVRHHVHRQRNKPARYWGRQFGAGRMFDLVPTRANGQPAFGAYLRVPAGIRHAAGFYVLTLVGDRICAMTRFDNSVLPWFGLPRSLPSR